jgi:hypothetical protein
MFADATIDVLPKEINQLKYSFFFLFSHIFVALIACGKNNHCVDGCNLRGTANS